MKKLFILMLTLIASVYYTNAQTIVSTDPENKKVVLEEFTGIYCGYCPQGHATAQAIKDAHPDDVMVVAIHTGGYAAPSGSDPDYRTPFGAAIAGQSGLSGYPSGTVNRHVFSGSVTALSRGAWSASSNQILAQASYLNVGVEATIVESTRQLVVEVEVYYTGDSPEATNLLNVALTQSDIIGYQSGGSSNYSHQHMLRYLLTGQWGVEITETTEGSLYSKTFLYEIPEDYNDIDVVLEDLEVLAFVSESHQEIISGNFDHEIDFIESNDYDAAITEALIPQTACSNSIVPVIELKNYGVVDLTSLEFTYTANGGEPMNYSWTGNLSQNETAEITLPEITYAPTDENTIDIQCESPNGMTDELPQNNIKITNTVASQNIPEICYFGIMIFENSDQVTWDIKDAEGNVVLEGGPYSSNSFYYEQIPFPESGCYELTVNDASGNGLSNGMYSILDQDLESLWEGEPFTYVAKADLAYQMIVDIDEQLTTDNINVYPNPVNGDATIEFSLYNNSDVSVSLFDVLGKNIMNVFEGSLPTGSNKVNLNANNLVKGIYFVKIEAGNNVVTKKIMVK